MASPLRPGLTWPLITEDDLDLQAKRFSAISTFCDDLSENICNRSMQQYIKPHPEKELLAYVQVETANWLNRIVPEESDKFVTLAAWYFMNCTAFVSMKAPKSAHQERHSIR